MDPTFTDLQNLMALEKVSESYENSSSQFVKRRPSGAARAIEFAVATLEFLRENGKITGEDLCMLAKAVGYDDEPVMRAWNTRCEFDVDAKSYPPFEPIVDFR